MRLPITAYVSILHRVSGVVTFFALALLLWLLDTSLASEQGFSSVKSLFNEPVLKFIVWGSLAALAYHLVAGLRHLVMDMGIGEETFDSGRLSAWLAAGVAVIIIAAIAGWIYL
jgi:succinate dehydrogenase / fumarate reductase cytochrome b subunit